LLDTLGEVLGLIPKSLTEAGLASTPVWSANELLTRIDGSSLLYDMESVCWQPWLNIDLPRFLRTIARRSGVIGLWPGFVQYRTCSFSAPGRRDHVSFDASGIVVLRPVTTNFPDEVPYTLERIP
jgi:hypothetical protein